MTMSRGSLALSLVVILMGCTRPNEQYRDMAAGQAGPDLAGGPVDMGQCGATRMVDVPGGTFTMGTGAES